MKSVRLHLSAIVLAVLCAPMARAQEKIGKVDFPVSCTSQAQAQLTREVIR